MKVNSVMSHQLGVLRAPLVLVKPEEEQRQNYAFDNHPLPKAENVLESVLELFFFDRILKLILTCKFATYMKLFFFFRFTFLSSVFLYSV